MRRHGLRVIPHWHESVVSATAIRKTVAEPSGSVVDVYGPGYWPGDSECEQLEFALKYDGTSLSLLAAILPTLDPAAVARFVAAAPHGIYRRRLWLFYEWLTGRRLPLPDLASGSYIDLVPADECHLPARRRLVSRQRINDNLPGTADFCPLVRRTPALEASAAARLDDRCRRLIAGVPGGLLGRALDYLYTKETKSSFAIERQEPGSDRTARFVRLLTRARHERYCDPGRLVAAQNEIVDPRFQESGFRTTQNYVGETVHLGRERVHYVCPPPEAVPALMAGLIAADARLDDEAIHPVIHATTISYGFVFIHPFEDGNGRLHRFLIHNILATRGFTPLEVMVPISAAMLRDRAGYDRSLEDFSRPLLDLIDYTLDADGRMHVTGDHGPWYRYPDLTRQAEAVFRFVAEAVERDLPEELAFLASYDRARESMRRVLDLPDRAGDLFIRLVNQNGGRLSAAKRHSSFASLTDDEIARLEAAVCEAFATPPPG